MVSFLYPGELLVLAKKSGILGLDGVMHQDKGVFLCLLLSDPLVKIFPDHLLRVLPLRDAFGFPV